MLSANFQKKISNCLMEIFFNYHAADLPSEKVEQIYLGGFFINKKRYIY